MKRYSQRWHLDVRAPRLPRSSRSQVLLSSFLQENESHVTVGGRYFEPVIRVTAIPITKSYREV